MAALHASPHGAEIIAMLQRDPPEAVRVAERRLVAAMAEAIRLSGPGSAVARAGSMAQALCWTARGLVHAVPDHAAFRRQLDSIVGALVARWRHQSNSDDTLVSSAWRLIESGRAHV